MTSDSLPTRSAALADHLRTIRRDIDRVRGIEHIARSTSQARDDALLDLLLKYVDVSCAIAVAHGAHAAIPRTVRTIPDLGLPMDDQTLAQAVVECLIGAKLMLEVSPCAADPTLAAVIRILADTAELVHTWSVARHRPMEDPG